MGTPPLDEILAQFKIAHQENCEYSGYFQRKDLKQCELVVSRKEGGISLRETDCHVIFRGGNFASEVCELVILWRDRDHQKICSPK